MVIFSSFSYSQTNISINHLEPQEHGSLYLNLESYRKTIFLLDHTFPSVTHDINYLNFKIDGSMMYPIYNSIPKKIFLTSSDTLTMSQLSFLQDHNEYFYDTSVALKSYLRKDINLLTQLESKSRKRYNYDDPGTRGINYDQKMMVSIYKDNGNSLIDAGYMYHYEAIPTYISSLDYGNTPSFRSIESYHFKLHYGYAGNRLSFKNNSNTQITNYLRPLNLQDVDVLEYLTQTHWNKMSIDYIINERYTFNFKSDYKLIASDVSDNIFSFNGHYHRISLGFNLNHKIHQFRFGTEYFNVDNNYHYFDYLLNLNKFNFFLSTQNNIYMNINYSNDIYFIDKILSRNEFIGFSFTNAAINTTLILGYHDIKDYSYFYYRLDNELTYKWVAVNLSYNVYDTNKLFVKNYMGLSIKVSPQIKNKRYRPYAKIKFHNVSVNNSYRINHNQLNIYSQNLSETDGSGGINITDFEIGVTFNYFKIGFIYENYYNRPFVYGYDFDSVEDGGEYFFIRNESDYLIEITWIFKD